MLDIQYIRENPEIVKQKSKQKGYDVDISKLIELDSKRREYIKKSDELRAQLNRASNEFKNQPPSQEQRANLIQIKQQLAELEKQQSVIDKDFTLLYKSVPNMPLDDVPIGDSEANNVEAKKIGEIKKFDFKPKTHWELAQSRDWIDKERAAKVAGSRFVYIIGDLAKLQFALIQYVIDTLTNEETIKKIIQNSGQHNISSNPFTLILPPAMLRTEIYDAMDRLEPREDRYKVGTDEDNLWLQGSAEHTLGPMFAGETVPLIDYAPKRYLGYATSFRREAGTYGKDTEGIIRMHQFDKLEMESFTIPEAGLDEHLFLISIQEYLMQQLGLAYRVIQKCTADIGKPNARGIDIEAWLPGNDRYLETHTADYMTNYQSRRLGTKVKSPIDGSMVYAHTNDATAFAMGRSLVAILENYQTANAEMSIPDVLKSYMGGKDKI